MPATAHLTARVEKSGHLDAKMKLAPYVDRPTFDLDMQVEGVALPKLNDVMRSFSKIDASAGSLSVYLQTASRQGRFKGYVQPVLRGPQLLGPKDENKGVVGKAENAIAGAVQELFENQPKDQTAARIPFHGTFVNPKVGLVTAVSTLFSNAFVQALSVPPKKEIDLEGIGDARGLERAPPSGRRALASQRGPGGHRWRDESQSRSGGLAQHAAPLL